MNRALFYGVFMKFLNALTLLLLSLLFVGCAGYQVGSTLPKSIQTVSLTVKNNTQEPSIEVQAMKALRAEVQQDGRLSIRKTGSADTVLSVSLTGYSLYPLAFDRTHGRLAREYRVVITATAVLSDAKTGKVLREIPNVVGDSEFPYNADLTSSKRGALPRASYDLARKVVSMTIAAW